ncbi:MAG: AbrB/MazE/SpoVT family DNA-binding domain-containing protein [Elusimicrobiota bacterium]|jgi:antitoxin VapB|nr:AbrB/MazE/SpoVT family DNA-binding domain-containing protein [Elusimicrobiota bacterium]
MRDNTVAKVFMSGNSQAVRLPKQFHIDAYEVYISKENDNIVLSPKQKIATWSEFFKEFEPCPEFEIPPRNPVKNTRTNIFDE